MGWLRPVFFNEKQEKMYIILACKILTDGAMDMKLGKVVYLITPHLHTKFKISASFIFQNIPVEIVFFYEKTTKKFTLFWSVNYIYI